MDVGVIFPQTEIGNNPAEIRRYALAIEDMGFAHLAAYDHILGASPDRPPGWTGPFAEPPYTYVDPFHEVFVLFGYLAAITKQVELITRVLVLPQRQTALVAKQAAEIEVLSGGRLRLGVGLGWNAVEYEALGQDFHVRGKRMSEQIGLLRALWDQELVDFRGTHDRIDRAGILPRPPRRTIPIWVGGRAPRALKRAAMLGDGWVSPTGSPEEFSALRTELWSYLEENGRSPERFSVISKIVVAPDRTQHSVEQARRLETLGATHVSLDTMGHGLRNFGDHLQVLESFQRSWLAAR